MKNDERQGTIDEGHQDIKTLFKLRVAWTMKTERD